MSTARNFGKAVERQVAKRIGGRRIGILGAEDVATERFSIECKGRSVLPAWFQGAMEQAEKNARPGTVPVVVWHRKGESYDDAIVALRLRDFEELMGETK